MKDHGVHAMKKLAKKLGNAGRCAKYRAGFEAKGLARLSVILTPEAGAALAKILGAGKATSKNDAANQGLIELAKRVRQ